MTIAPFFRPCAYQLRQHECQNAELFPTGHPPALTVHPDGADSALLEDRFVLPAGPIVGVHPNGVVRLAPFNDFRILDSLLSEHSGDGIKLISDQSQRLSDRRDQRFIQEKARFRRP